jgi:hypothetical protein
VRRRFAPQDAIASRRLGVRLIGLLSLASAGISGLLAREHATLAGAICGAGHNPHCGWCYGAVGFALAGLTALVAAAGPQPQAAASARSISQ